MNRRAQLRQQKLARAKHEFRSRPSAPAGRPPTLVEDHPAVQLAHWMNASKEGWPWADSKVGKHTVRAPVDFHRVDEAERLQKWLLGKAWSNMAVAYFDGMKPSTLLGTGATIAEFIALLAKHRTDGLIDGRRWAQAIFTIARMKFLSTQSSIESFKSLHSLGTIIGCPSRELAAYCRWINQDPPEDYSQLEAWIANKQEHFNDLLKQEELNDESKRAQQTTSSGGPVSPIIDPA